MTSKGQTNLLPLHLETLSPQIHGFIRAYVRQLERRSEPQIEDEPGQKTALQVARAVLRVVGDRYETNKLVSELGDYLRGAVKASAASQALQKLLSELRGGDTEALSVPTPPAPAPAPAAPEAPVAPPPAAPAEAPAPPPAPAPVEHVPAPAEAEAEPEAEPEPAPAPLAESAETESPAPAADVPSPSEETEEMVHHSPAPAPLPHESHPAPGAASSEDRDILDDVSGGQKADGSDGVESEEEVQS